MLDPLLVLNVGWEDADEVLLPTVKVKGFSLARMRHLDAEHDVVGAEVFGIVRVRQRLNGVAMTYKEKCTFKYKLVHCSYSCKGPSRNQADFTLAGTIVTDDVFTET